MPPIIRPIARRALATLSSIQPNIFTLDPRLLKKQATDKTGLSDFGEADYEEGLEVLCRAAEEDADLHHGGRYVLRQRILSALTTRLRLAHLKKKQTEAFDAPLIRPLLIIGLPRSGTTLLHRLLSLAEDARPLATWEVLYPIPGPGLDLRRILTPIRLALIKKSAPDLDAKHRVEAEAPEECTFLLDSSFRSLGFWVIFPVFGYLDWLLRQDMQRAYRMYYQLLQFLQRATPEKRLVLKAPAHTGYISELLSAIPELKLVQTHRDPVAVTASVNSMLESIHGGGSKRVDRTRLARSNLRMLKTMMDRNLSSRKTLQAGRILDVRYDDLLQDPIAVVKQVLLHSGLPCTDGYVDRVERWLAKYPQGRFGRHSYSLNEFGIEREELLECFGEYTQAFL